MTTLTNFDDGMPCWVDIMVPNQEQHHDKRAFLTALFDWTWELGTPEMGHYATARSNGHAVMGLGIAEGTNGAMTTYFSTNEHRRLRSLAPLTLGATGRRSRHESNGRWHDGDREGPLRRPLRSVAAGRLSRVHGVVYEENSPGLVRPRLPRPRGGQ